MNRLKANLKEMRPDHREAYLAEEKEFNEAKELVSSECSPLDLFSIDDLITELENVGYRVHGE